MPSIHFLQAYLSRQKYVDLMFAIQRLFRLVSFPEKTLNEIQNHLLSYYETHPDSQKKPRILCAILVYYYGKNSVITKSQIIRIFNISSSWFRKNQIKYLQDMNIEVHSFHQRSQKDWRWLSTVAQPLETQPLDAELNLASYP